MNQTKYDVFISYSRKDYVDEKKNVLPDNEVSKIKETLKKAGITFWFDEECVYSGDEFAKVIVKNIKASCIFVFLSTSNSNFSEWTASEISTAHMMKKKIIPVRLDSSVFHDDVILYLSRLSHIDYYENPEKGRQELVRSIKAYLENENDRKQNAIVNTPGIELHIDTDADCDLYRFKTFIKRLQPGEDNIVCLQPGKYKLLFISKELPEAKVTKLYNVESGVACDYLEIKLKNLVEEIKSKKKPETTCPANNNEVRHDTPKEIEIKTKASVEVEGLHISTDSDCDFYQYITFIKRLRAGEDNVVPLPSRKYRLMFISSEFPSAKYFVDYAPPTDKTSDYLEVKLKDVIAEAKGQSEAKRLKNMENAKRRAAERRKPEVCRPRQAVQPIFSQPQGPIALQGSQRRIAQGMVVVNGVAFKMIRVSGGAFMMGATDEQVDDAYDDEKPAHKVTLSDFLMGETPVTQELWYAVMGNNPSVHKGRNRPIENVSWDDCQQFISKLNRMTGKKFRLPTEAEWEFAARGGIKSKAYKYSGSNNLEEVGWYDGNSNGTTHSVKQKKPNELGIYDMSGNTLEWCQDWYGDYGSSGQTNPKGPKNGYFRVYRGGGWNANPEICRVSTRLISASITRLDNLGLRLAL